MAKSTHPFLVTKTSQQIKGDDLFTQSVDELFAEKDTGTIHQRQKPVKLYVKLLKLFMHDKSLHVVDACGGAGSCALACQELGIKCIVLDKSGIKVRLIKQRAK